MRRAVVADTGPLYAAADPDDMHHARSQREIQQLAREKREVIVVYPTLLETYTLVLFRLGKNAAAVWLRDMEGARLVNPGPEDYRRSVTKISALPDQPISLFDAIVAIMAARLDLPVWTYDHHFDLMRVRVWR